MRTKFWKLTAIENSADVMQKFFDLKKICFWSPFTISTITDYGDVFVYGLWCWSIEKKICKMFPFLLYLYIFLHLWQNQSISLYIHIFIILSLLIRCIFIVSKYENYDFIFRETFNVGAVANLRRIKPAISVARKVLEHTTHSVSFNPTLTHIQSVTKI